MSKSKNMQDAKTEGKNQGFFLEASKKVLQSHQSNKGMPVAKKSNNMVNSGNYILDSK